MAGKLTLIVAPAGFGKTMLSEAFMRRPVAWVSLEASDNDATRFWSYALAALNLVVPGVGDTAFALLQAPQPPPLDALMTTLLNALDSVDGDATLVFDDYHAIEMPAIHDSFSFLLDHLPHTCML